MRRQRETAQRKEDDANTAKELTELIGRWRMARDVRLYASELVAMVSAEGRDIPAQSHLGIALARISAYADRIDPAVSVRDMLEAVLELETPDDGTET
jgi:hypothetical protein